ncbi:formate dehydrogenase accessory sulfurtransferase FdhD [Patulibacter sp.]|uniref:formate dehydrogenase accessory sulfurtransferase FdhD n=1 Tax=Patulibacter sp. TaxID=1912859 RepID=UPI002721C18A|nr:formate dehydrogenase accessory sulfurtransferase FdhD [Patulibacter sp.]MDO9409824.1 formate dehydrogenase accessory sulfurtransferase FdhD [Patulibacter sp.]
MAPSTSTRRRVARTSAVRLSAAGRREATERLIGEEPLEIRVAGPDGVVGATTATMRTPGHDFELAAGLLRAEGVIAGPGDLAEIRYCTDVDVQQYNVVTVHLRRPPRRELAARSLMATASCGVCGTASIDELCDRVPVVGGTTSIDAAVLAGLPDLLREEQSLFAETGGNHGAGVFRADGSPLVVREDVGRHNALDKALGARLLAGTDPGEDDVVVLSGRVSFELVQKTAAAGVPILVAVSAPSSLAVETAQRLGVTLAAFVREGRATLYAHPERVVGR